MDVTQHGFPVLRMQGQQAECEHAMGLAATHALAENEDALVALAGQPAEAVTEQLLQAVCQVVLGEEIRGINFPVQQVGEIQNGVAA